MFVCYRKTFSCLHSIRMASGIREEQEVNPQNYMNVTSRRIVIREKCNNGAGSTTNPVLSREIVIKELDKPSESRAPEQAVSYPTKMRSRSPSPAPTHSSTPSQSSSISAQSCALSSIVTLDPQPKSCTILSKAATPNSKASRTRVPGIPVVSLSPHKTIADPAPTGNKTGSTGSVKKLNAYQAVIEDVSPIPKVLPESCSRKYERFTYLPGNSNKIYLELSLRTESNDNKMI